MKKIFLLFILMCNLSFSISFNDIDDKLYFTTSEISRNVDKLKEGDIILFKPLKSFTQSFGHVAIIGRNKKMIDFPNRFYGFREIPFSILETMEERPMLVLRYKYMTEDMKDRLMQNIYNSVNKKYSILVPRSNNFDNNYTYCSLFVYEVYEKANEGKNSIFPMRDEYIYPVQFLLAGKNFSIVDLNKE